MLASADPIQLKQLIRNISRAMLNSQSKRDDFEIKELVKELKVYGHWMSLILVSGQAIKVTFKIHFMSKIAKELAAPIYALPAEKLTEDQGLDFMREFCNLSAGAIKKALLDLQVQTGVSIPVVTRGFDELFFPKSELEGTFNDTWALACELGSMICSSNIDVYQAVDFSQLPSNYQVDGAQGDVEFL